MLSVGQLNWITWCGQQKEKGEADRSNVSK